MNKKLQKLQQAIYNFSLLDDGKYLAEYSPKLSFFPVGDLMDISFYGEGYDDDPEMEADEEDYDFNFPFCGLLDLLCEQKNADKLISINFSGFDQGANGFKSWDFSRLINSDVNFPNLKSFSVELTDLGDHNLSIIDNGGTLEENGMIAKLLSKMPILEELIVPSVPDKSFFEIGEHPLKVLKIQVGNEHQNFIDNFASSKNFTQLHALDFAECAAMYNDTIEQYTTFDSFKKMFASEAFSSVKHFKLRNSILTEEQLFELQKMNNVQFLNIKARAGQYVEHLMKYKK